MTLTINGEKREVAERSTVRELLQAFKIDQKILVVELNRGILDKESYATTVLQDGDQLEIVHFVGGG